MDIPFSSLLCDIQSKVLHKAKYVFKVFIIGLIDLIQHVFVCVIAMFLQSLYLDAFVSLQTFAIPGSIFLSILSGYLYPFPLALFLVCLVSKETQYSRFLEVSAVEMSLFS